MRSSPRRRHTTAGLSFPLITGGTAERAACRANGGYRGRKGIVVLALAAEQSGWRREDFGQTENTGSPSTALHRLNFSLRLG